MEKKQSKAVKTISDATLADLVEQVGEWYRMTDDNLHSEVLCNIAAFFELGDFFSEALPFMASDCLTVSDTHRRADLQDRVLNVIGEEYGEAVVKIVRAAL